MDLDVIIETLRTIFVNNLSYNITYISILFILYFYASSLVKHFLKGLKIGTVWRFILFSVFLTLGTSPLIVFLTNLVLSIPEFQIRWAVMLGLLIWSFIKFDEDVARVK
ncbi:MAG: hypothetical protein V1678_03765 [Candidatus Aenigmatarchaeota archaeon]